MEFALYDIGYHDPDPNGNPPNRPRFTVTEIGSVMFFRKLLLGGGGINSKSIPNQHEPAMEGAETVLNAMKYLNVILKMHFTMDFSPVSAKAPIEDLSEIGIPEIDRRETVPNRHELAYRVSREANSCPKLNGPLEWTFGELTEQNLRIK